MPIAILVETMIRCRFNIDIGEVSDVEDIFQNRAVWWWE